MHGASWVAHEAYQRVTRVGQVVTRGGLLGSGFESRATH